MNAVLNLAAIASHRLERQPYAWAAIDTTFADGQIAGLARSFPSDHFKDIVGNDGEKSYRFKARPLIDIGASGATQADDLDPAWRQLAAELASVEYRKAMQDLTGVDLTDAPLEANITEYGQGAWLGPHLDLDIKLVSHIFYFSEAWKAAEGGALRILRSSNANDVQQRVLPLAGQSVVIVRSGHSWHDVEPVAGSRPRRALDVIFHRPGAASCLWLPGEPVSTSAPYPASVGWRGRLSAIRRRLLPFP